MLMDRTAVAQDMDRPTLVRFVGGASLAPAVPTFVELDLHCTSPNIGCNWVGWDPPTPEAPFLNS